MLLLHAHFFQVLLMMKRLPYAKIVTVERTSTDIPWGLNIEGNRVSYFVNQISNYNIRFTQFVYRF